LALFDGHEDARCPEFLQTKQVAYGRGFEGSSGIGFLHLDKLCFWLPHLKQIPDAGALENASALCGQSLTEWPFSRQAKQIVLTAFWFIRDKRRFSVCSEVRFCLLRAFIFSLNSCCLRSLYSFLLDSCGFSASTSPDFESGCEVSALEFSSFVFPAGSEDFFLAGFNFFLAGSTLEAVSGTTAALLFAALWSSAPSKPAWTYFRLKPRFAKSEPLIIQRYTTRR